MIPPSLCHPYWTSFLHASLLLPPYILDFPSANVSSSLCQNPFNLPPSCHPHLFHMTPRRTPPPPPPVTSISTTTTILSFHHIYQPSIAKPSLLPPLTSGIHTSFVPQYNTIACIITVRYTVIPFTIDDLSYTPSLTACIRKI